MTFLKSFFHFSKTSHELNTLGFPIGSSIIKTYHKTASAEEIQAGRNVSFPDFIQYIVDQAAARNTSHFDEHWTSYVELCQPCTIQYDIIGKEKYT